MQPPHHPKTQTIDYDSIMKSIKIDNHQPNPNTINTNPALHSIERQANKQSKYLPKATHTYNYNQNQNQKQKQTDYSLSMSISTTTNKSQGKSSGKPMSRHKSIQKEKISVEKYLVDKMMYERNVCGQGNEQLKFGVNGLLGRSKNVGEFQFCGMGREGRNLSHNYSQHCLNANQQQHRHIPTKFSLLNNEHAYERANSKQSAPKPSKYLQLIKNNPKFPHIVTQQDKPNQNPSQLHTRQNKYPPHTTNPNPNHNSINSNITFSELNPNTKINNASNGNNLNIDTYTSNKNKNANYVYSSIVFDDLSKQSCFESVCRVDQARTDGLYYGKCYPDKRGCQDWQQNTKRNSHQFILYENSISKKRSSKNIGNPMCQKLKDQQSKDRKIMIKTPSKFKKFKTMATSQITQNSHQTEYHQNDKQNNTHLHNRCQNKSNFQKAHSNIQQKQARYLTHTQTSQKKIKQRRQTGEAKNLQVHHYPKKGLLFVNNSQICKGKNMVHRPGIEIINERHYQS